MKRLARLTQQLLLLLLTVAIVSACSSTIIKPNEISVSKSSASCRVVQHPLGETCVPNNPKRIVNVSWRVLLGDVLALGIKPVGSSSISGNLAETFVSDQAHLKNKVKGIKNLGSAESINIESILQIKPDLILLWEYSKAVYPLLSKIAPTVIIPVEEASVNWKERLNIIAKVLGREEIAQQVLNRYGQRVKAIRAALGNRYQDKTISIVYPFGHNAGTLAKNSFVGSILEDLGLQRPPAQNVSLPYDRMEVSDERLDVLDGDIMFFGLSQDRDSVKTYKRLKRKLMWQRLKSVQKGQVYPVEFDALHEASPLAADVLLDDLYKYLVNPPQSTSRF
jgi:iron complex transport system substrate-binding protein